MTLCNPDMPLLEILFSWLIAYSQNNNICLLYGAMNLGRNFFTNLDMRLTAPLAVRGGKNSSENQLSPDSIRRRILSRSLSVRSVSNTGVELRELSLELSPPLLLAPLESLLHDCHSPSTLWTWFTMIPGSIYILSKVTKNGYKTVLLS